MEEIEVEVRINETVTVKIDIGEVISEINNLPNKRRWNYVAQILNMITTDLSELTEEQKTITKNYLTTKLNLLSK